MVCRAFCSSNNRTGGTLLGFLLRLVAVSGSIVIEYEGNTKKCLDLPGGNTNNGNLLQIWDCNGSPNQEWEFDSGSWQIKSARNTGKCVDVRGGLADGSRLQIWDCNGHSNQIWGYDSNMKTIYAAKSDAAGTNLSKPMASKCMDLAGGSTENGNGVQLWGCNGLANQRWAIASPGPAPGPSPGPAPAPSWAMYKQCDSRWKDDALGTCAETICNAGCAMSSTAMYLKTRGVSVDPGSLNAWLKAHGGYASGCELAWGSVDHFGKTSFQGIQTADETAICAGLKAGHGIIANVHGGRHWVLLTGCQGGGVYSVNDPGFDTSSYKQSDILQEAVYHPVGLESAALVLV